MGQKPAIGSAREGVFVEIMDKVDNVRIINSRAPIRVCDIGGWTDTWFARYGDIFNIGVNPCVEVQLRIQENANDNGIKIVLENFGETYELDPDSISYNKHPLIEAAIGVMHIPVNLSFEACIFSPVPPGAATGTSAAVSIALIGALDVLTPGRMTPYEIAMMAHAIETKELGLECGIQDQLASAYGGLNYIQMHEYPHATVSRPIMSEEVLWELENRLVLVYIGKPHYSSEIHKKVIESLGANASDDKRLHKLRELAREAKDAVSAGDMLELGRAMDANTKVQRDLNAGLVCPEFERIIGLSKQHNALGHKVNGAGGDGGTLTLLTDGDSRKKRNLIEKIEQTGAVVIEISIATEGIRIW